MTSTIDTDVLFTFAELGVALAGFSAIVGVLRSRHRAIDVRVNSLRLQVMLETCFMVSALSVIPVLLHRFGMESQLLWRTASAVFLAVAIPFEFVARKRTKDMPDMTLSKLNVNTINWMLSIASDLIMFVVLVNLVGAKSEAAYILALFLQLTMAGLLFIQFAAETFRPVDRESGDG